MSETQKRSRTSSRSRSIIDYNETKLSRKENERAQAEADVRAQEEQRRAEREAQRRAEREAQRRAEREVLEQEQRKKYRILHNHSVFLHNHSVLSGEFYDISVPTYINKFGRAYIKCIWKYGISIPITKYINELKEILDNSKDDKSEKREKRLEFLELCNTIVGLPDLFISITNYINGGTGDSQYENQKLVLTAAGGNIIIIFAKFINNLLDNDHYENIGEINKKFLDKNKFIKIKNELKIKLTEEDKTLIKTIYGKDYSDFDFKITPNKQDIDIKQFESDNIDYLNNKSEDGFILMRCKSALNCKSIKPKMNNKDYSDTACFKSIKENLESIKKNLGSSTTDLILAAQTIQSNFFTINFLKEKNILPNEIDEDIKDKIDKLLQKIICNLENEHELEKIQNEIQSYSKTYPSFNNFFNCLNFFIILYKKKIEIARQTQINVKKILENFKIQSISENENILYYLHNTTEHLNKYIKTNNNVLEDIDINSCFVNVSTLLTRHDSLPMFIGNVFNYLVTYSEFKNSEIIDRLIQYEYQPNHCEQLYPAVPKIYTYFSKIEYKDNEEDRQNKNIQKLLTSLLTSLNNSKSFKKTNDPRIPAGFRIVINVIKNKSRLLIPLSQLEAQEKLDELLFLNEKGEEINFDISLPLLRDEELLDGVPDDAMQTLLEDHGYTCEIDSDLMDIDKMDGKVIDPHAKTDGDAVMAEASGIKTIKRKKRKKKLKKKTKKRQVHPKKKHARHRTQHRPINRPRSQKRLSKR